MNYDYIIVGAGSAGCILAERLSASGRHSVLLLEAGGSDNSFWFKIPIGFAKLYYDNKHNWMYYSEPEPQLAGRQIYAPRGKVQGGSGSINAMIYVRGAQRDYDDWAAAGNPGWSYQDVLPYFRKLESHPLGDTTWHGANGPVRITPMKDGAHPICQSFIKGCEQLGYERNDDFNGARLEGVGIYDVNTRNGQRASSSFAYLHRAGQRPNLKIEHHAQASRVLFDVDASTGKRRASGVEIVQQGVKRTFHANREVIVSAGAVDSPKLLQLSGVGPRALLAQHGIEVMHELPAVGQNLQDHLCVSFYYRSRVKTLNDTFSSWASKLKFGLQYLIRRTGPFSMSVNQSGGFFRTNLDEAHPNMQVYFNPLSYRIPKSNRAQLTPEPYSGFLVCFNPCRPTSRGSVEIASENVADAPKIRGNYLSTQKDRDEAIAGSRLVRKLMTARALQEVTVEEVTPAGEVSDDASMLKFFREQSGSIYHLCGTCAMGPDPRTAVVDARLRVHGIEGLRVVDASIFPNITSGNTNAPTMMVAEKGAQMIIEDADQEIAARGLAANVQRAAAISS
ncbi:Oxygen-dependent choline dehydrogenase [Paraburkholderia caffeinitolerans]|uniref:Oxygen-dependent choline dehydrogenase n=1 Tax=Paraburkholderia caffeinitolerans TaxID=1723730 RepID=A0A6J5G6T6_9BURK|nr:GMC family oxidoreductase N-terminal domain-containing protein [Paraburkholderia caffeinitolerans]CAB3794064.1 Oxygen-dependent choline dehydrogenase [Paraburkholderia caffeinitolerans]